MCNHGIVYPLCNAPRELIVSVHSVWQLYIISAEGAVHIRTEGVRKFSLQQSGPHVVVKCHTRSRIRTPNLRGTTEPPNMCKHSMSAVWHMWSRSRTDLHRGCAKLLFERSGPYGVVKCNTRSRIRTPNLRGTTGPPSMCQHPVAAAWLTRSRSRTDPGIVWAVHNFRTGPNGLDRTESIKFGPDRTRLLCAHTLNILYRHYR